MNVSKEMKMTMDNYDFTEINCKEQPFGIVLESFHVGYSKAFYMGLKLIQSYNIKKYMYDDAELTSIYDLQKKVLKDFFSIDLFYENADGNMIKEWIEDKINCDCIPIIYGNLKELYYSKYFKKVDWGHFFLIHGYNKKNQLFYIVDSSQAYKEEHMAKYGPFVMEYEVLEKMYKSGLEMVQTEACYINCSQADTMCDLYSVVLKCLDQFTRNRAEQPFKEIEIINKLLDSSGIEDIDLYAEKLLRIRNAKRIFHTELIEILELFEFDSFNVDEFTLILEKLLLEWQRAIYRIISNKYRAKDIDLHKELEEIFIYESMIYEHIRIIEKEFINKEYCINNEVSDNFENNEDNIIRFVGNEQYEFNFPTGKIYSSYGVDDSPKVIIGKNILQQECVLLRTKLSIIKYNELSEFLAGIVMRTEDEGLYFWGECCKESIRLDLSGINNKIYEFPNNNDTVELWVKVYKNNNLIVGYVDQNNKLVECFSTVASERICEVGIGCKTWGSTDTLVVNFQDTALIN